MPDENISLGLKKAHCPTCQRQTNSDIRGKANQSESDDETEVSFNRDWYILQCRGCEEIFIQTIDTDSESYHAYYDHNGELQYALDETVGYWPKLPKRRMPNFVIDAALPNARGLESCLYELYSAIDSDLQILSGIGIRTCFDAASTCLGIDPALYFNEKLDALVTKGLIRSEERSLLDVVVDAGNAAAHRAWEPSPSDLGSMMDVLEHFLDKAFQQPVREKQMAVGIANMKEAIPPKPKRQKPAGSPQTPGDRPDGDPSP